MGFQPTSGDVAACGAAVVLAALSALHVYWVAGGRWPGRDDESLAQMVVGSAKGEGPPGWVATLAVAAALLFGALVVLAVRGLALAPVPSALVRAGAWGLAAVFAARGLGGFAEERLRPVIVGTPYARWNRAAYSPLCVVLAATVIVAIVA